MKFTSALSVRQFLANIHPPLPKTRRESQQLINVLESSFRKHLDDTHPAPQRVEHSDVLNRNIPLAATESSSNVARQHFTSILTHPFIDQPPGGKLHVKTLMKHAVERYQRAFLEDAVTINVLVSCVREYCQGIRNGEKMDPKFKLGPLLSSWVSSTSLAQQEAFFLADGLLSRALFVMAFEGEEATMWNWLRRIYERDHEATSTYDNTLSHPGWLSAEDHLVSSLMRCSIRRKDLEDAAQQFVKACEYRVSSGRASTTPNIRSDDLKFKPMLRSWNRLIAAILFTRKRHNISTPLFDSVLQSSPGWHSSPLLSEPFLSIYHPESPSAQILCITLRNVASAADVVKELQQSSSTMRRAILVTMLDGAQLSMEQKLWGDARFLLTFAGAQFSEHLSTQPTPEQLSIKARIRNMWSSLRPESQQVHEHSLRTT